MLTKSLNTNINLSTIATLFIIVFTAFAPPSSDPLISYWGARYYLLIFCGLSLAIYGAIFYKEESIKIIKTIWQETGNRFLILWLILSLISCILSANPYISFWGTPTVEMGWIHQFLCVILFFLAQKIKLERKHWTWLSISLLLMVMLTLLEAIGFRPLFWLSNSTAPPATTIGQRGHLAGWFAVAAGVSLYRNAWPSLVFAGVGIVLCNNTASLLGFVVASFLWMCLNFKNYSSIIKLFIINIFFLVSFSIYSQNNKILCDKMSLTHCTYNKQGVESNINSLHDRVVFWKAALKMFAERPLLGWGNEQFEGEWFDFVPKAEQDSLAKVLIGVPKDVKIIRVENSNLYVYMAGKNMTTGIVSNPHPHNFFIEELQSHGVLGFLSLIFALMYLLKNKPRLLIASAPYAVYLLGWFLLISVAPIFSVFMGIIYKEVANK